MLDGSGLTFDKGKINFLVNIYSISSHLNSISRAIVGQSLKSHPRLCGSLCAWILPGSHFILLTWSFGTGPLSTGTPRTRTKPSLQTKITCLRGDAKANLSKVSSQSRRAASDSITWICIQRKEVSCLSCHHFSSVLCFLSLVTSMTPVWSPL